MSKGKCVLIIDDEPDAIEIVETMLSELNGITIISAHDGISGLAKAKETIPDLVILDIEMPGKNGFEVFTELKTENSTKDIPVIMLTGVAEKTKIHFSSDNMNDFLGSSPDAYIEKPVNSLSLQSTVLKLIR